MQSPIAHRLHYDIIVIGFQYQINDIVMVICYIAINHCVVCPVVALHSQLCTVTCDPTDHLFGLQRRLTV